jgi:hypothetical protein
MDNKNFYDITKLYEMQERRQENKKHVYELILRKIHHQIDTVSYRGDVMMLYRVPEFLIGSPTYNPMHCVNYSIRRLIDEGFRVKYVDPHILFISWKKEEPLPLHLQQSYLPLHHQQQQQSPQLAYDVRPGTKLTYNPTGKLFR